MPLLLLKFWKELLLVSLFAIIVAMAVGRFNTYIDARVQVKYEQKILEYREQVLDKVKIIEDNSTKLVQAREEDQQVTRARLDEILAAAQRKGYVTITKEGKCNPSKEFSDSYNELISEGNRR